MSTDEATFGPRILTPDQRPRVFISSTLQELAPERAAARAAVERLRLIPVMFELGARPHPARALYRAYLAQSHVFVALYFERYGWVAPGEEISGLEDEYRLSGDLPRLVYLKAPAPHREPQLGALLDAVRSDDTVSYKSFSSAEELERLLSEDLAVLLAERFLLGGPDGAERDDQAHHPAPRPMPAPVNTLLGRTDELAAIERFLTEGRRLVSVVGPGGIGKTRLALEAVRRAGARDEDQVAFVPLEAVEDPAAVLPTVASSIGLGLDGGVPVLDALAGAFGDRPFVLLLDNFEQVLPAATDVAELLTRCPAITIVVTSRAALRIRGEMLLPLGPLSLPSDQAPDRESAAVRLFVERARAVRPGFSVDDPEDAAAVAELCRRLDGIPLALELAAGRSRLLPPRALLERLGTALDVGSGAADLPPRQRTLRDTLAWSEQLLEPQQRSLLAALSVFAAPWTLSDAEQVAPPEVRDVLEDVAALVENSLVSPATAPGEPRFRTFDTVRAYAAEQLDASGARDRAEGACCARMIRQIPALVTGIRSRDQARWRAEFRLVWPDLRAAWERVVACEDGASTAIATQLIIPLWLDGRSNEVVDLVDASVQVGAKTRPPRHGELVLTAAHWAFYLGDYERVQELLSQIGTDAVPLPEDADGLGAMPLLEGYLAASDGDLEASERLLAESVALLQRGDAGARWIEAFAHNGLGSLKLVRGDVPAAVVEFETSRSVAEETGNLGAQMQALAFIASLAVFDGRRDEARDLLMAAAELVETQPFYEGNAYCLEVAAAYALGGGNAIGAARALGQARALRELIGARVWALLEELSGLVHAGVREELGDDAFDAALARGGDEDPRAAAATVRALLGDHAS